MKIVWRVIPCVAKGLAEGRIVAINTFGIIPYIVEKKKKTMNYQTRYIPKSSIPFQFKST